MAAKRKSTVNLALDSFVESVNRTGGNSSLLSGVIFLLGGGLATYMGYAENYIPTLLGGPIALIIGAILVYKSIHKARNRRKKHNWG